MPVNEAVWTLEPHSKGKHDLLREYLPLWLQILGTWHGDLVLYDGFAGPGEYADGEEGSPIIMLHAAKDYSSQHPKGRVRCVFVDNERERVDHLKKLVDGETRPAGVDVSVLHGEFADEVTKTLRSIARHQNEGGSVPSFFMIDPFGIKGVPFSALSDLLSLDKSECLFTLMWDAILRFREHDNLEEYMLELFGDSDWRGRSGDSLKEYVYSRFEQRLREAGAEYVRIFHLWKEGRHIYSLFFATKGLKGCDVMKQAIWKVDRTGSYTFRGAKSGQSRLDMPFAHSGLRDDLRAEFGSGWVSVEQAEEFVQGDRTMFHSGHLRKETLYPLEREGVIEVERPKGGKGFPTDKGIRFRFRDVPKPPPRQESLGL